MKLMKKLMFTMATCASMMYAAVSNAAPVDSVWKFQDGYGTKVTDSGASGFHGKIDNPQRITWKKDKDGTICLAFSGSGSVVIPHNDDLLMRTGFELKVRFSCDLSAVPSSNFSALVSKGDGYSHGYSLMVSKKGGVLVTLNGLINHYAFNQEPLITSNKIHEIRVVYDTQRTNVYVDGVRVNGYPVSGVIDDKLEPLHLGGIPAYPLTGKLYEVSLRSL